MRILMLLDQHYPPDIRVEKETRSLIQAGHEVTLLTENKKGAPEQEYINDVEVERFTFPARIYRKLNSLIFHLSFYSPIWSKRISQILDGEEFDALHVHDLPLLGTAIRRANIHRIPIIADLHENYPAMLQIYQHPNWLLKPWVNNYQRWQRYELRCVRECDRIIVVVDEAKERLTQLGIPEDKISIVSNTEDVDNFNRLPLDQSLLKRYNGHFVISYVGGFGPHRGLQTAIEAMPTILEQIPDALLLLVGDDLNRQTLERQAERFGVSQSVRFTGWQPFDQVPTYIALSQVCLVPYLSTDHTESTVPHKLFQYMLMGKPVVASNCRPLKRIVDETGSGLVFPAGDAQCLSYTVIRLKDDPLRQKLGDSGKRAVYQKYNWQQTSNELLKIYAQLDKR